MDPETPDLEPEASGDASDEAPVATTHRRPRPVRPAVVLLVAAAIGMNLAGLAVVTWTLRSTAQELERRIEVSEQTAAETANAARIPAGETGDLLEIALRLEEHGDVEGARRIRAAARSALLEREGEDGAFRVAARLLEQGRTRDARRALYRILARADQPGTRWGELAVRARFLVGESLAAEADDS